MSNGLNHPMSENILPRNYKITFTWYAGGKNVFFIPCETREEAEEYARNYAGKFGTYKIN